MGDINWKGHITADAGLHHGDLCIKETRISVM